MLSLSVYSQNDTSKVVLPTNIARQVYQDLLRYDGCLVEVDLLTKKIIKLNEVITSKDSVVSLLNDKDKNNLFIISKKDDQLTLSQELSEKLHKELKSERRNGFLWKTTTVIFLTTSTILLLGR